nr:MAG TPA: hypothetical protein [Caudoviricetes sp.]
MCVGQFLNTVNFICFSARFSNDCDTFSSFFGV